MDILDKIKNGSLKVKAAAAAVCIALLVGLFFLGKVAVESFQASQAIRAQQAYLNSVTGPYQDGSVILPNVYVGDTAVGNLTKDDAVKALTDAAEAKNIHTITVHLPDRDLTFSTELPNLPEEIDSALQEAGAVGRESDEQEKLAEAVERAEQKRTDISFAPEVSIDKEAIAQTIEKNAMDVYTDPIQSQVEANTNDLYIGITKGTPGRWLDAQSLTEQVLKAFEDECYDDIDFAYSDIPVDEIPVGEYYYQYTWRPRNAYYDAETQSVAEARVGYAPDIPEEEAIAGIAALAPGESMKLPFHVVEADYDKATVESLLFRDVLASYGSEYTADWGRTENLRLACERINGTVIQPGEVFSFNETVGQRTADKGYQTAIVYINGKSEPQIGGGICQVASTIYYCCLYAEMEIVEREPHMFMVTYVPGGMDATVYWGSLDYKFRNNTYFPLKINAYLSGGRCYIELVGTDFYQHHVEMESIALSGTAYQVNRYVYDKNWALIKKEDLGVSRYSVHK